MAERSAAAYHSDDGQRNAGRSGEMPGCRYGRLHCKTRADGRTANRAGSLRCNEFAVAPNNRWKERMNQQKRILIVEDDDLSRKLAMAMVESLGHEADSARDGLEALAKLKLEFDLVLLDIQLPAMDGYEIARRIRIDPRFYDLPIVMVTSLESREDRLRATEAGANDFIAKPIDKTELRIRTNSLLKMKEAQDALKRQQMILEETVARRTATLHQTLEEMVEAQRLTHLAQLETIHRLALASEYKDKV